jgi:hypothetical protein
MRKSKFSDEFKRHAVCQITGCRSFAAAVHAFLMPIALKTLQTIAAYPKWLGT